MGGFIKIKKKISIILISALLISSAFSSPLFTRADDDWGGLNGDSTGSNRIAVDYTTHRLELVTNLKSGSTSALRIRSIGWSVTIHTNDGRSASAIFESKGDNADGRTRKGDILSGYSFPFDYVINEFTSDAGSNGESIARDFFYGTGAGGGGHIEMTAFFVAWHKGATSFSDFACSGGSDGATGVVSAKFNNDPVTLTPEQPTPYNWKPGDANMFAGCPSGYYYSLDQSLANGIATNLNDANKIPAWWGGSASGLSDYYPAIGDIPASHIVNNDLTITFLDMGTYRINTDVYQSCIVTNNGMADVTPSDNCLVHLSIPNVTDQQKQLIVPAGVHRWCISSSERRRMSRT